MECRVSLILGLAVGVLGGSAGCTPSLFTRNTTTTTTVQSPRDDVETVPEESAKKDGDAPKRKPKALTCVSYGEFCLRESLAPGCAPDEARARRAKARLSYEQAVATDPQCVEGYR